MRIVDVVLLMLSLAIIGLLGFSPLFQPEQSAKTVEQECRLFYGPSGDGAVATCRSHMLSSRD